MTFLCWLLGHRWEHQDRTAYECRRCGRLAYGVGYHDGLSECYRPPHRRA